MNKFFNWSKFLGSLVSYRTTVCSIFLLMMQLQRKHFYELEMAAHACNDSTQRPAMTGGLLQD